MYDQWSDPWAPRPHEGGSGARFGLGLLAAALGVAGALAHELRSGSTAAAGALAALAIAWELALSSPAARRVSPAVVLLVPVGVAGATTAIVARSSVLVALWSVAILDAGLRGRRHPPGTPPGAPNGAALAVPPVVAAGLAYAPTGRAGPAVGLLAVAAGVVVAAHRFPQRATAVDATLRRAISWLGDALATIATAVVVLPLVYLPGVAARAVRAAIGGGARPQTTWRAATTAPDARRRDAAHMFATTEPLQRRRRLVATGVAAALGLLVLVVTADGLVPARVRSTFADGGTASVAPPRRDNHVPYSRRRALAGVAFADALEREQNDFLHVHLVADPDTRYGAGDFAGRFTNTSGGERRSAAPASCRCAAASVWLLGGSAAFGIGQRDDDTIASFIARDGSQRGKSITVRNLAVPGWVLPQEIDAVTSRLDRGEAAPDLVVFYDGYNDAFLAAAVSGVAGRVPAAMTQLQQRDYDAFRDEVALGHGALARKLTAAGGARAVGELAAAHYLQYRQRAITELGRRGVASSFFVQTDAMVSPQHARDAALVEPGLADPADMAAWSEVLATMDARLRSAGVTSLRDVPVGVDTPIFIDSVHTSERGAQLVADALLDRIADGLGRGERPSGATR